MKRRVILILFVISLSACATLGYYSQAVFGHLRLVTSRDSISDVLQSKSISAQRRAKLESVLRMRRFASEELKLPDNDSYRYFTELEGDYVVWNVVATPRFSVNSILWCFPVAGCVPYRGYFEREDAEGFAQSQRAQGYDVAVAGASAYSTLGWFADPVFSSMLDYPVPELAGFIFHELAHQRVYVKGGAVFNEAFASFVGQKGAELWLDRYGDRETREAYRQRREHARAFNRLLLDARAQLQHLYEKHSVAGVAVLKEAKQSVFDQLRSRYGVLSRNWSGAYDPWMAQDLNNAHLALVATYRSGVPAFEALFEQVGGNWKRFYRRVEALAEQNAAARTAWLEQETRG